MRTIIALASVLLLTAAIAQAQTDFSTLQLRVGDAVFVTEVPDLEVKGRVVSLSATRLELDNGWTFRPETTMKIDRHGDPPWNGLIIGAIAGALATAAGGWGETSAASLLLSGGLVWGGVGLLIDLGEVGRTPVYRGGRAMAFSVSVAMPRRR